MMTSFKILLTTSIIIGLLPSSVLAPPKDQEDFTKDSSSVGVKKSTEKSEEARSVTQPHITATPTPIFTLTPASIPIFTPAPTPPISIFTPTSLSIFTPLSMFTPTPTSLLTTTITTTTTATYTTSTATDITTTTTATTMTSRPAFIFVLENIPDPLSVLPTAGREKDWKVHANRLRELQGIAMSIQKDFYEKKLCRFNICKNLQVVLFVLSGGVLHAGHSLPHALTWYKEGPDLITVDLLSKCAKELSATHLEIDTQLDNQYRVDVLSVLQATRSLVWHWQASIAADLPEDKSVTE